MRARAIKTRAGFTLVEVLIAVSIFALIAAAGAAVIAMSIDNRFAVKQSSDRLGDFQRTRALLQADLGQATARRPRGPNGQAATQAMTGARAPGEPMLSLTRAGWSNPGERARSSLQRVEYRLNGEVLERRIADHVDGARLGPTQTLYRGVEAATLVFIVDDAQSPAFVATPARPLPDAVRLDMTLQGFGPVSQVFVVGGGR